MKISRRETIIGLVALFTALFGFTYHYGSAEFEEHRQLIKEKAQLERQIQLHRRIIDAQGSWTNRLAELQAQLPIYDRNVSVTGEILKMIKRMADETGLDLTKSRADREKQVGRLYELSVICDWEGALEELVHFLYQINEQGLRFDIRELSIRPDAKRAGILRGDMIIDCAYRRKLEPPSSQ